MDSPLVWPDLVEDSLFYFRLLLLFLADTCFPDCYLFFQMLLLFSDAVNIAPDIGELLFQPLTLVLLFSDQVPEFFVCVLLFFMEPSKRRLQIQDTVSGHIIIGGVILKLRGKGQSGLCL